MTERVEINPDAMMSKPVIRGTRIPVVLIVRKLSEGATEADLLDAYPRLVVEDIRAALDNEQNPDLFKHQYLSHNLGWAG